MDIISHGLYGGIAFGRKSRISYWKSFFFGIMPDLFSFGIFFVVSIIAIISGNGNSLPVGPHDPASIPQYVHTLYSVTHSLIIAGLVIVIVSFFKRSLIIEMLGWPLHILVDIPTHSNKFFPTLFLWPVSDFHVNGTSWGSPYIFIPNVILLTVLYFWFYKSKKHANKEKPRDSRV